MAPRAAGQVLCPIIVGRDAETSAIAEALTGAREGRGGLLFLVGEAGIGKTRLARHAEERARQSGMRAIRGRAAPGAGPIPFRPLAEAIQTGLRLHGVPGEPELEPYRPALRGLVPAWSATPSTDVTPLMLFEGVSLLMRALAAGDGLVVLLEDLHWADADTLGVLDYLADAVTGDRVLVVGTVRDEPSAALDLAESIAARRAATRLSLRRLSADEVVEMARRSLDADDMPEPLLETLVDRAEGVPFVVEEMLTAYVSSGSPEALPHTYRELVRARMSTLNEGARAILDAAATIGRRFEWQLLASVTGLTRERVLEELRAAVDAKLVVTGSGGALRTGFGFRHALVRDALVAELLPPERAHLAARAADAIEDSYPGLPGEWCERLADLREIAGDHPASARHLQEAAKRALVRGALGSAEAMLERARALVESDRWHLIGIDRDLVEVLSLAGKTDRLREIGATAIEFVQEKRGVMPFITLSLGDLFLRLARGLAASGDDAASDEHLE
ncbi:MAG: ATP-binding protein, partial [Actinomycetota bacterium]